MSEPFDDRFDDNNRFKRDDMNILNLTKVNILIIIVIIIVSRDDMNIF